MSAFQMLADAVQPPAGGAAPPPGEVGLALYAQGIGESDYVARVAPPVRALAPQIGDLIDVGAGGGQLGGALRDPARNWTAVEPSPVMQARLKALPQPPTLVPLRWEQAGEATPLADTVLAATMPGYFGDPVAFLAWCRRHARRRVIWIAPAQRAPRGLLLAGCLPARWHQEDETPGVDLVLQTPGLEAPDAMDAADWSFSLTLPDLPRFAAWQAGRLGWGADDPRRAEHLDHLAACAEATPAGARLSCGRRSAILIWNQ